MNVATTGRFPLGDTGDELRPCLTLDALSAMPVRSSGTLHLRPDGPLFTVRTRILARRVFLAASFPQGRLVSVELILQDGPGADGMADQLALKREHEQWLDSLGFDLHPLAYVLDDRPIEPAQPGPEHPARATAPWGEVVSLLDQRNGGASIIVRYRNG